MPKKAPKKKKQRDPLVALKYRGYCRAFMPPGDDSSIADFIVYAKFSLCRFSRRLWNDPVWNEYTDEEILVEYFSHLYHSDQKSRQAFEMQINASEELYGDIMDWLDRKVAENQAEMAKKAEELPDRISFAPDQKDVEEHVDSTEDHS